MRASSRWMFPTAPGPLLLSGDGSRVFDSEGTRQRAPSLMAQEDKEALAMIQSRQRLRCLLPNTAKNAKVYLPCALMWWGSATVC